MRKIVINGQTLKIGKEVKVKYEDNLFEFSDFEEWDDSEVDFEFEKFFEKDKDQKGFSQWDLEYDDI